MGGTADGTARLLAALRRAILPGGVVLLTSRDVTLSDNPVHRAYHAARRAEGRPPGELRLRLAFGGREGPWFGWHHLGPAELAPLAEAAGWRLAHVIPTDEGPYAAVLA